MSETGSNDQFSILAIREELKEVLNETQKSRIPLFIAALAALLSIVSLADDETDKVAMSAHIEASNQFAYFQAKSIRKTSSLVAARLFEKMDQQQLATEWQKNADRYSEEKSAILKTAKQQQKIRADALRRGDYYKVGVTLLQIAIVLASASLVVGGGSLFVVSVLLTIVSLVYSLNGFGMFFEFPTNPGIIFDWMGSIAHQIRYGTVS